jgi:hypothetical protein
MDPNPSAEAGSSISVEGGVTRGKCLDRRGRLTWGAAAAAGRQAEMEDAHAAAPKFLGITCSSAGGCAASAPSESAEVSQLRFFGVYDGHGGSQVLAEGLNPCGAHWHKLLSVFCLNTSRSDHQDTGGRVLDVIFLKKKKERGRSAGDRLQSSA